MSFAFCVVAAVGAILFLLPGLGLVLVGVTVLVAAAAAAQAAAASHGPARIALALVVFTVVLSGVTAIQCVGGIGAGGPFVATTAVATVSQFLCLLALAGLHRSEEAATLVTDAIIIAIGLWLIGWVITDAGRLSLTDPSSTATLVRGVHLPIATAQLAMLWRILIGPGREVRTLKILTTSFTLSLVGATLLLAHDVAWVRTAPFALICLVAGMVVMVFVARRPDLGKLGVSGSDFRSRPVRRGLTAVGLLVPQMLQLVHPPDSTLDSLMRTLGTIALTSAVIVRIAVTDRENERVNDQLRNLAWRDRLTGILNLTGVLETLATIVHGRSSDEGMAVVIVDLDQFRSINDTFGYPGGDLVLSLFTERLVTLVGGDGSVGRIGADSFVVLRPGLAAAEDVQAFAEAAGRELDTPFVVGERELLFTGCIGIAIADHARDVTPVGILRDAETALNKAKSLGRNQIATFDDRLRASTSRRLEIESSLLHALRHDDLTLHYQPLVDLQQRRLVGFEALSRWNHPVFGPISPAEFVPVAEDTGMIGRLWQWSIRQALTDLRHLIDAREVADTVYVSVNLSPRQLADTELVPTIHGLLVHHRLDGANLVVEVTESAVMDDPAVAKVQLERLRSLGCGVAIDDFGTGHSSLSNLRRFPFSVVKIDRSFVAGIAGDPGDRALVEGTIDLCRSLSMEVVAEGVENPQQAHILRAAGCSMGQGYLFHRPASVADLPAALTDLERVLRSPDTDQQRAASAQPAGSPAAS